MKEDNTPTVTSRRRKPTPHQRLRLEKAKELKKDGVLAKNKRLKSKEKGTEKAGNESVSDPAMPSTARNPKLKQGTLSEPAKPLPRYQKRQVHKSWMPTHIWHAKRAHMTEPQDPLWRFALPLKRAQKSYRPIHRAGSMSGCVVWDTSYMGTIAADGREESLLGLLRSIGVDESMLTGKIGAKWRKGTRSWEGWLRERDREQKWIAPVKIVWLLSADVISHTQDEAAAKIKRKLLVRVHPSAFFSAWNEILKVAKMQRPAVSIEDWRFEIGSIELSGPNSTEALLGILHPVSEEPSNTDDRKGNTEVSIPTIGESSTEQTNSLDKNGASPYTNISPETFSRLTALTNPSSLPDGALLAFDTKDSRLFHPPHTVHSNPEDEKTLPSVLSEWLPDKSTSPSSLFSRDSRLAGSRLPTQKAINRRKAAADPGSYPTPLPTDPQIPVMLIATRPGDVETSSHRMQGSWTLLLPWACVLPVWYSLVYYPLSTGGTPLFGALEESKEVVFDREIAWFPGDFPGTSAGWAWELRERATQRKAWELRPKGRRCEWGSLDLGEGSKGEIGLGWGCDWERLFTGATSADDAGLSQHRRKKVKKSSKPTNEETRSATQTAVDGQVDDKAKEQDESDKSEDFKPPPSPPLSIHHVRQPFPSPIPPTALTTIHISLYKRGHLYRNARIYRLPTQNMALRARWLSVLDKDPNDRKRTVSATANATHSSAQKDTHDGQTTELNTAGAGSSIRSTSPTRLAALAQSLLPRPSPSPEKETVDYPPVPDEDDLIGFVTTANYSLSTGKYAGVGNVALIRVLPDPASSTAQAHPRSEPEPKTGNKLGKEKEKRICIVRNAGERTGRLARWRFI